MVATAGPFISRLLMSFCLGSAETADHLTIVKFDPFGSWLICSTRSRKGNPAN